MGRSIHRTLALTLALAGCSPVAPLPSDTFYRLVDFDTPTPVTAPWTSGSVYVEKFRASGIHQERAVVFSEGDGIVLKQQSYHHWADSPALMLQDALAQHLRKAKVAAIVTTERDPNSALAVGGEIYGFELDKSGGQARAVIRIGLEARSGSARALIIGEEYTHAADIGSGGIDAAARAMSSGITQIFDRFVADVSIALTKRTAAAP